jgi:para-nitrobenzyl esterase
MLGVSYVKSAFVLFGVGLLACCLPITVAAAARKSGKSATDDTFRCPAEFTAATHAASGQRVWRFQMEHAVPGELRIDHGSELTFIFDNRPLNISVDGVRPLLQSYWVNFITRGDPNGTGLPQWPAYGGKRSYLAFTDVGPQARTALRAPICALLQRP